MTQICSRNPVDLFTNWYDLAKKREPNDPNAMCLATIDSNGTPSARMVLLKEHGTDGFVFYTNLTSRKGAALTVNPRAALCFHWKSLKRQIRIEGDITQVSDGRADRYFASRPRGSQIGAWASKQSQPLRARTDLIERTKMIESTYQDQEQIPRPDFWSGFSLYPKRFEFWEQGDNRLHDRFVFTRKGKCWQAERLYP